LALALPVAAQSTTPAANSDAAVERNVAGTIELIEGDVRVLDTAKAPRSVAKGSKVYEGESIVTGGNGEVHLAMEDSGFIGVRPDTRMRFTKYQANGEATDTSVIGLLQGAVRSVTGWIGKNNASAYQIRTPTATIGVRGTDHETLVIPQGKPEAGSYDKVNIGGTFLQTKQGKVNVDPDRAGFVSYRAGSKPQLLARVPQFFKPTRHESVFKGKHEAIQKVIEQRREEKRKVRQEKAAKRQAAKTERKDQPREKHEAERQKRAQERHKAAEERKGQNEERQKRHEAHKPAEPQKGGRDRDK
jgi:flagellar biosynthesis GTPase FlhF